MYNNSTVLAEYISTAVHSSAVKNIIISVAFTRFSDVSRIKWHRISQTNRSRLSVHSLQCYCARPKAGKSKLKKQQTLTFSLSPSLCPLSFCLSLCPCGQQSLCWPLSPNPHGQRVRRERMLKCFE